MTQPFVRSLVTAIVAAGLAVGTTTLYSLAWPPLRSLPVLLVVAVLAAGLGVVAGILGSYDLSTVPGWALLAVDHVWALPSTLLGAVVGNLLYPFFGTPSTLSALARAGSPTRPAGARASG